jgi:hypothetical protein
MGNGGIKGRLKEGRGEGRVVYYEVDSIPVAQETEFRKNNNSSFAFLSINVNKRFR